MAIDLIPIQFYTPIFYHIILLVVLLTFIHTQSKQSGSNENISFLQLSGILLLLFVILYMGLRPIHGVFIDMKTYARMFERYQQNPLSGNMNDPVFESYIMLSSKIMSVHFFFFVCALLYILPLYIVSKKWFKVYWFYAFLFLVGSLSFWAYGVNGIRNGIAGSLFLLGISRDKRVFQILWILLAVGFHKSMLLPAIGFLIAQFYNNPKGFLVFWAACIPLSLVLGGFWENFFAGFNFVGDERLAYLTTEANAASFSSTGFRWDFLIYSAAAVFAGWYYIFRKQFKDKIYFWLFNTYVFANAFWILVIRANFSNRFAYLSWFMMAFIIIYPLLKKIILVEQHQKIGIILMAYYMFTYIMAIFIS